MLLVLRQSLINSLIHQASLSLTFGKDSGFDAVWFAKDEQVVQQRG